ncbi:MAG: short-chain dehydrogenase [Chloroflexi bacterium RBG_13_66_10]|nr:MAG: short-chain dehydrogenase [Chloroflexi bacterium RBG_13_66_10]
MGALEGKRWLITGAASGIGRASAMLFAREGASLLLADLAAEAGQAAADEIAATGGRALFTACDVTREEDCARAVGCVAEAFGGLDGLLNCAGIVVRRSVTELEEADWDRVMAVNAKSVYLMSKHAAPAMGPGASIINLGSGWGLVGGPRAAAYCASKGAVVLLTKAMAIDLGPKAIRVNCLCPGDTDTPMLRQEAEQLGVSEAEFLLQSAHRPLGRIGTPEEIARAALFLAGDASSYMTGSILLVDGGGLAGG